MPLIVFSKGNVAGETIAKKLIENHNFKQIENTNSDDGKCTWKSWYDGKWKMLELTTMHTHSDYLKDYPLFNSGDLIVVLSTHRSEAAITSLSVHSVGNFCNSNKVGGNPLELGPSSAAALKVGVQFIMKNQLAGFTSCMEATHHGPTSLKSPMIWVEIGSSEKEYRNEEAGELLAKCTIEICSRWKRGEKAYPKDKTAVAFGGIHYCPKFTRIMAEQDYEIAYVCSKYNLDELNENLIKQMVEKSSEKIEVALIEKKSMNAATRDKIAGLLRPFDLPYELV